MTTAPAAQPAEPDPAREAFEARPEASRKTIQDAMVWAGLYHGTLDGAFGKGTKEAIVALQKREKLEPNAILDDALVDRLTARMKKAKEAVRFVSVADSATGLRLGLPTKILTKKSSGAGGTRFVSADGKISVETQVVRFGETPGLPDLATLYDQMKTASPERKVTYKALKANVFFVVSGERGERRFYTRFAQGAGASGDELRGYTLTYPTSMMPEFERVAIAVSNAFEPFPQGGAAATAQTAPEKPAARPQAAPRPQLSATGVIVAPATLLSVLPDACTNPTSGGAALTRVASDPATGLTLLSLPGLAGTALAAGTADAAADADLIVVGYTLAEAKPSLNISAGTIVGAPARILSPVQQAAGGSAIFDRSGTWLGLVGREDRRPKLVAGIVPQTSRPMTPASGVIAFLNKAGIPAAAPAPAGKGMTAGSIAVFASGALRPIECVR